MARKAASGSKSATLPLKQGEVIKAIRGGTSVGAAHLMVTIRGVTRTFQVSATIVSDAMSEFDQVFNVRAAA